jgi:hypothetical protein
MNPRLKCLLILIAGVLCVGVYLFAGTTAQQEDAVSPLSSHPDAAGDPTTADRNIFFSPSSISTAFTITAEGVRGKTLDELRNVFHLPADPGFWRNDNFRI